MYGDSSNPISNAPPFWYGTLGSIALCPGFVNRISKNMNKYLFLIKKTGILAGGNSPFYPLFGQFYSLSDSSVWDWLRSGKNVLY